MTISTIEPKVMIFHRFLYRTHVIYHQRHKLKLTAFAALFINPKRSYFTKCHLQSQQKNRFHKISSSLKADSDLKAFPYSSLHSLESLYPISSCYIRQNMHQVHEFQDVSQDITNSTLVDMIVG